MNRLELLKSRFAAVDHPKKERPKYPMRLFGGVWIPDQTRLQVPDRIDFKFGDSHPIYNDLFFLSFTIDRGSQIWRTIDVIKKHNTRTPAMKEKRAKRENKSP